MAAKARTRKQAEAPVSTPGPKLKRRPTIRTEENRANILAAIEQYGMCDTSAADYAGISYSAFKEWKREDAAFLADLSRARAKFKAFHMENIVKHARQDARHSEWLLARLFPTEFSERQVIDSSVTMRSPLDRFFARDDEAADDTSDT